MWVALHILLADFHVVMQTYSRVLATVVTEDVQQLLLWQLRSNRLTCRQLLLKDRSDAFLNCQNESRGKYFKTYALICPPYYYDPSYSTFFILCVAAAAVLRFAEEVGERRINMKPRAKHHR